MTVEKQNEIVLVSKNVVKRIGLNLHHILKSSHEIGTKDALVAFVTKTV